jgi:hypothetical protein
MRLAYWRTCRCAFSAASGPVSQSNRRVAACDGST